MTAGTAAPDSSVTLIVCARVSPGNETAFRQWQSRWQHAVLDAPGALSCDLLPSAPPDQEESIAIVRFSANDALRAWRASSVHRSLVAEVSALVEGGSITQLAGTAAAEYYVQRAATELIVTKVRPGKEAEFRAWSSRIEREQNAFPGFIGAFVHPPQTADDAWTTVLRFDTVENLEAWLRSPQRLELVREAEALTNDLVVQRFDASFPGWAPNDPVTGAPPNPWRTAALVLLVLLPVVMLEIVFLDPRIKHLNRALWALIDVGLGVSLTTWPLMPMMVSVFKKWIFPDSPRQSLAYGAMLFGIFVVEMAVSWYTVH
jgi:antibiotic biosynthesis monooxygenase (ABM) superfamily enzyme